MHAQVMCVFDSTGRTAETTSGDKSDQEMCLGMLLAYPLNEAVMKLSDEHASSTSPTCI